MVASSWHGAVDRYFHVSERGSTVAGELKAGATTFLTASYIMLVNPQILGKAGLPVKAVVTATGLSAMLASLICGLAANQPVSVSPGMGLNAFLVFSQVLGLGVTPEAALAGCFVAACVVAALALVRALHAILAVVPKSIKLAVVVGMGLLLAMIGLQSSEVVVASPSTMVTLGPLLRFEPLLAIGGLALISALHYRNVRGSILVGVAATTVAYCAVKDTWPHEFVALPHLHVFKLDFGPLFVERSPSAWSAVLAYVLVMVFDIGGAMFGLCNLAGLVDAEGHVSGATATYLAASAGTALGALTGTTPLIIAAESAVGIKEGGRTGLVAVTVAACFGLSVFVAPLLQAIPQLATAPVLVLVGAFMLGECVHIDWGCILTAVPAFLTIVIQPFTFSISNGIYAGLLMSALLHLLTGEAFAPLLRRGSAGDAHAHPSPVAADVEAPLLGREQHPPSAVASPRGQPIAIAAVVRRLPSTPSDAGSDRQGGDARSFTLYLNTAGSLTLGSLGSLRGSSLTARQHGGGSSAGGPPSHDGHPPAHR